ncbi:MAG: phosphatase PAP2 family protein, partial [Opitutaceae bacterium]|nr:phosphatase PAP2 family protein [Verrucomicrobiales bacterium]
MSWLSAIDTDLFRFLNQSLSNRFFDAVIPFFSGNAFFVPLVLILFGGLVAWGGRRGRVVAFMLLVGALAGDGLVSNNLKKTFGRVRPCHVVSDTRSPGGVGCSDSGSMPSSHSFNWAAATCVAFIYY